MINQERCKAYLKALFSFKEGTLPQALEAALETSEPLINKARELLGANSNGGVADQPLVAILSRVFGQDEKNDYKYFFQPCSLSVMPEVDGSVQPVSVFPEKTHGNLPVPNNAKSVEKGLQNALNELSKATKKDLSAFSYAAYHLLHKYLTRSASADSPDNDVSVFDHQRILAAVVNCLSHGQTNLAQPKFTEPPEFVLLKGDISGIQKFIYHHMDLTQVGGSNDLSKKLRGRSFYVTLLTNFLAERFLEHLELTEANLIYSTGGQFMILAPAYVQVEKHLDDFAEKLNRDLRKKLGNGFNFLLGYVRAGAHLFEDTGKYFTALEKEMSQQKANVLKSSLKEVMKVQDTVDEFLEDVWLGNNIPYSECLVELTLKKKLDKGQQVRVTRKTAKNGRVQTHETSASIAQIVDGSIGEEHNRVDRRLVIDLLVYNKLYFMPSTRKYTQDSSTEVDSPYTPEDYHKLKDDIQVLLNDYADAIESATVISLNKTNIEDFFDLKAPCPVYHKFYFLGSESRQFFEKDEPLLALYDNKPGDVMHFDGLQMLNYTERRGKQGAKKYKYLEYPMLGAMRLDVDYLGSIFAFGLESNSKEENKPNDRKSFTRLATLSREFHLFFAGYFNVLVNKYQLYTTYSGGDDAFVVGSWYNLMHFAQELHQQFKDFTCHNPYVTFSAGLFFCDVKHPVGRFAYQAEDLEKRAKNFQHIERKKDPKTGDVTEKVLAEKGAISVFDHTLSWEHYECMLGFGDTLLKHVNNDQLSRSLVHRLIRLIKSNTRRNGSVDVLRIYRNTAKLHYLFARYGFKEEHIKKATDGLAHEVVKVILRDFKNPFAFKDYLIPTSYVLWKTRKINELNKGKPHE
ncbi:type III-A CRISPR-associated protein Cas10/Csm1 [Microscilla marina]|uniref:Crispr-associated protein, Csm1 family, putative n=1 Tax=Microscilla marina ATCC 23134 TaxID=313606 RepID=A1ZV96_MICM2|nr:hypothetical protein [Microscilla marina]EAY25752.1 crispr-associated protein, Csm1 family, putative [Microscilla marina ATCC 23134]